MRLQEEEEDPLDAFMAAEILPEVAEKQAAERAAREKELAEKAALRAVRRTATSSAELSVVEGVE